MTKEEKARRLEVKKIKARIIKKFKRASPEERQAVIDYLKESIENDER